MGQRPVEFSFWRNVAEMIVFGFAKDYTYDGDGTLKIQVRIPSAHGPYRQESTKGIYVQDKDLPWITSVLLPQMPSEGDVVLLQTEHEGRGSEFYVIGLTGGNYHNGSRI